MYGPVILMELSNIKGIGPAKQQKLKEAGVDSVDLLARCDVDAVSKKSGLSADSVKQYKQKAVALTLMEDVKGMGPETVKVLAQSGIASLKDLYEASADFVAKEAQVAKDKAQAWQKQAQDLAARVASDAKTADGRKKLAGEAKDAAVTAAKKTQEMVVELLQKAQAEGEAAIAKAKELKEKAPGYVAEAREKAEKALKDADNKVKELQGKAPEAVKDLRTKAEAAVQDAQKKVQELQDALKREAEKVKAANEGFLGRLRAKFSKN